MNASPAAAAVVAVLVSAAARTTDEDRGPYRTPPGWRLSWPASPVSWAASNEHLNGR